MSEHPDYANLRTLGDQYWDGSSEPGRFQLTTITHDNNQVGTGMGTYWHCCCKVHILSSKAGDD
jgi:hypothetical protein